MTKKKNFFFISFEEAQLICNKVQYGEASFWEKVKLNVRLVWCNATRKFTQQNNELTTLCKAANLQTMNDSKKDELKKMLESKISNSDK